MNDHVVNDQNEASNIQRNDDKLRIVGAIFALNQSCYSFLDIAISMCGSLVKIMLQNKRRFRLILPRATWTTFIKERKNVEEFLQLPIGSSPLSICDLVLELVELPGDDGCPYKAVKLKLTRHGEICVVPETLQYLFEIEKSVEDEYSELCQYTDSVNENKPFVNNICDITERLYYYEAINIILQNFDKNSDTIVPIDSSFNTKFYACKNRNMH